MESLAVIALAGFLTVPTCFVVGKDHERVAFMTERRHLIVHDPERKGGYYYCFGPSETLRSPSGGPESIENKGEF